MATNQRTGLLRNGATASNNVTGWCPGCSEKRTFSRRVVGRTVHGNPTDTYQYCPECGTTMGESR